MARRRRSFAAPVAACAIAAISGAGFFSTSRAEARERIRIRAESAIVNVGLVRGADWAEVTGGLRDDAGQPIAGAAVVLDVVLPPSATAGPCRPGDAVRDEGGRHVLGTDTVGFFCVRLPAVTSVEDSELRFDGDPLHGAATARVPRTTGTREMRLSFDSKLLVASLDEPSFVVNVATQVVDGRSAGDPVRLVLVHRPDSGPPGREMELGATDVPVGSTARFDVETRTLAPPGTGKLVVRFRGSGSLAPREDWTLLERHATARVTLASEPPPSDPTNGVDLMVGVSSSIGAVPDGWVEALTSGQPVGLAEVSAGAARVTATFAPPRGRAAVVTLRYVPAGRGWLPGEPVTVTIPVLPPSPRGFFPWLLAALGIAYWVVRAWRRPKSAPRRPHRASDAPVGRPLVDLIEQDATRSGWKGRVIDAHEGGPVAFAKVKLVVPVFDGEGVAATCTAGEDGSFSLPHVAAARSEGARLVVTAPEHSSLTEPVPPDGLLSICLVSRRRALLDRLVRWAARAGRPWSRRGEPTPGEVAETSRSGQDAEVSAWAAAIQEAAYGPIPPDEAREVRIVSEEPAHPGEGAGRRALTSENAR